MNAPPQSFGNRPVPPAPESHHALVRRIAPRSKIPAPERRTDRIKHLFWLVYGPAHPWIRDIATALRLARHHGRQPFILGSIDLRRDLETLLHLLKGNGYGRHAVAWKDSGEIASLRLATNFTYQYHVRIFADGEVRAHYEYTPEAHPILHMLEVGMQPKLEYFKDLLGSLICWHPGTPAQAKTSEQTEKTSP